MLGIILQVMKSERGNPIRQDSKYNKPRLVSPSPLRIDS